MPAEVANDLIGSHADREFDVWPDNWAPLELFLLCQTQWRTGPGGLVGLDYGAVLAMASLWSVEQVRETMAGVQVIEAAILAQLSKERR